MNADTLTRIYQGRVNQVHCDGKPLRFDEGKEILWKHHEVYQDAVNYYLVALAGMAEPGKSSSTGAKFRQALEKTWGRFVRNGVSRPGMGESLARTLSCVRAEHLSFNEVVQRILGPEHAPVGILNAGLQQIEESLKSDLVQPAGKYLSQLCSPDFDGNFDFGGAMNKGRTGMVQLLNILQTGNMEERQRRYEAVKEEIQLTWVGQKTQEGCYTIAELQEKAVDIIGYLLGLKNDSSEPVEVREAIDAAALEALRGHLKEITRADIQKIAKGPKNNLLVFSALLLISTGELSLLDVINTQRKTIEKKKKEWGEIESGDNALVDDPIKLARGSRGYVFQYFTALPSWSSQWKEFDKEAFVEAFKTLNQFKLKTAEREARLAHVRQCLSWMETGDSPDGKPPKLAEESSDSADDDGGELSGTLPVLGGDPRWSQLQKVLCERLALKNDLTNDEVVDYGLSERTIRGAEAIFREWNDILKTSSMPAVEKELRDALVRYQRDNSQTIGSAPLFMELTKAENHIIWDSRYSPAGKYPSKNLLKDAVVYFDLREEAEYLAEPIQFSPADARFSRRLSNLKVLSGQKSLKGRMTWGTGYGLTGNGGLAVPVVMRGENGKYAPRKVVLEFSAPRLLRDRLICNGTPVYCPPLVQAFIGTDGDEEISPEDAKKIADDLRDSAVQFMPDFDRKGKLRLLLNFQPSVDVAEARKAASEVFPENYFYGAKDEKICLKWPGYDKTPPPWCESSKPFDIVSVDLGQRTAGAVSRIRISTERQDKSIYIGNDGKRNWFALQLYGGLLRLPGEDCKTADGRDELSGSAGRLATVEETEAAKAIASDILGSTEAMQEFLVADIGAAGELFYKKYFPVQNDSLLRVLKRGIYRLRQLSRWHFFWKNGEESRVREELQEASWLPEKSLQAIQEAELRMRERLKDNLLRITERILPLRGRHWELQPSAQGNGMVLAQTAPSSKEPERWICGQRGLSFARLEQLENLRHCFQSINRILMEEPGARRKSARELRGVSIPDCCPDILMRLDELKEQRVNQTANMILAQALGMRHKVHASGNRSFRDCCNVHGEYERIPGLPPASFVVIENLSRYRFSQGRSKFENSRLMKWAHRAIRDKLKMLCEVYGLTVVEVNAGYSSKFSPDGIPGFRAEELLGKDVRKKSSFYRAFKENSPLEKELKGEFELQIAKALEQNKPLLVPKQGGPVFVPFRPVEQDRHLVQADINASLNLGLRAVAHVGVLDVHHKITIEKAKNGWRFRNASSLGKKLLPKTIVFTLGESASSAGNVTNLFVCGCPCREMGLPSATTDGPFAEYNGKMMVGGGIWKNRVLELKRCLEINRKHLK